MEALINSIELKTRLDLESKNAVKQSFKRIELAKGEKLLAEHQYTTKLYYIEKGTIRSYYYHDAKEVTSWLYSETQFFTSWHSFLNGEPSFEYIETLEPCTLYWISKDEYDKLLSHNSKLESFGRKLIEEQLAFLDFFYRGFLYMSAREKYDLLLSVFPEVTLRVNLGHIASLLGISQETLSRIRNQKKS